MKYYKTAQGYKGVSCPNRVNSVLYDLNTHYVIVTNKGLVSRIFQKKDFQTKYHPDLADGIVALLDFNTKEYQVVGTEAWYFAKSKVDDKFGIEDLCEANGISIVTTYD